MIVWPEDKDLGGIGGKAAALAELARRGFGPPAFFVILPDAIEQGAPSPALREALGPALARLGPGPYAVRSSGLAEDGAAHSHAGQFDTVLNVLAADVPGAATAVWRSGGSERLQTYASLTGQAASPPAIVVQRMIAAQLSGVAFSADPVSGLRGRVVISAIAGLGDRLVSGEVDGQGWVLERGDVLVAPQDPILTGAQLQQVADLARRAEASFGAPQDIEWAFDADGLHILQARPITTPLRPAPVADKALTVFDNSNIVESYPGMVSPLTYSFAVHVYSRVYRAFVRLLGVPEAVIAGNAALFDNMLGRREGRVYYNLVNWYRALALLPGFALNRAFMEGMMGLSEPLPQEAVAGIGPGPVRGAARLREYLRLARVGAGIGVAALRLPRTRRAFYARLNRALQSGLDLDSAPPTALAAEYRQIEANLLDRWDAPLVNDFLCMIAFGASRSLLRRWLGAAGLSLHNDVMIGQGDIVSAEPAQRILEMGRMAAGLGASGPAAVDLAAIRAHPGLSRAFDSYLAKFADRCPEELKLESVTLDVDPAPLVSAIAASAANPVQGAAPHQAPAPPDWGSLFAGRPLRRWAARALTQWAKARVRDRENLRFERTRIFGHARRVFLALGRAFHARGALDDPRDIFWLTKDEVLGAVEGFALSPDLKGVAALRKAEDAASALRPDPAERLTVRGPAATEGAAGTRPTAENAAEDASGDRRQGTGCSAGEVTARARVIRDPRTERLDPGDILVARHTDPGWIAVFSSASAIVVERGSLLSHSAIVARELGIPCVVGLKEATRWIEDGAEVSVNGGTGEVVKRHAAT